MTLLARRCEKKARPTAPAKLRHDQCSQGNQSRARMDENDQEPLSQEGTDKNHQAGSTNSSDRENDQDDDQLDLASDNDGEDIDEDTDNDE